MKMHYALILINRMFSLKITESEKHAVETFND